MATRKKDVPPKATAAPSKATAAPSKATAATPKADAPPKVPRATPFPTRVDLGVEKRLALIALLNRLLAHVLDLQAQARQAHWNVRGPNFLSLHALFDTIAGHFGEAADTIAEQIGTFGGLAEGTVGQIAAASTIPAYPVTVGDGAAHVRALADGIGAWDRLLREAIEEADEIDDPAVEDLLTGVLRTTEKDLWVLERHLDG